MLFKFKVDYWDELNETSVKGKIGLVTAKSWSKAIKKIRQYYGKEYIGGIYLEEWVDFLEAEEVIEGMSE